MVRDHALREFLDREVFMDTTVHTPNGLDPNPLALTPVVEQSDTVLGVGETAEFQYTFSRTWCQAFLMLSGDRNRVLHCTDSGLKILQGVALLAAINQALSSCMRNHLVTKIESVVIRKFVVVEDTVTVVVSCTKRRLGTARMAVRVRDSEGKYITDDIEVSVRDAASLTNR